LSMNYYSELFLDPLAKLQKNTISFVASDSPSVHMEQLGSHWMVFIKFDI